MKAVLIALPFSGTDSLCRICGSHGASMRHVYYWGIGDGMWRECTRCGFGWLERCPTDSGQVRPGQYV